MASAIGIEAIQRHGKRARFFTTVELVNALEQEKASGRPGQIAYRLMYVDLVVLDELDCLPFSQSGGALLFHLLSKLYERTRYCALFGGRISKAAAFVSCLNPALKQPS